MLKILYFGGHLVVNIPEGGRDFLNLFELDNFAREAISEHSCDFNVTSQIIDKISDIPSGWENAIPINRTDDKTCKEIYEEEILPTKPIYDSDQMKFEFSEKYEQMRDK